MIGVIHSLIHGIPIVNRIKQSVFYGIGVKFYFINILNYCLDLLEIIKHTTSLLVFGLFVS